MQKLVLSAALAALLSGCHGLGVYKIDIDQGNVVTREQAEQLKVGMSPTQVRFLLGNPLVTDTLHIDRWDYAYTFRPGTYAQRANQEKVFKRALTIWFDAGKVARIDGLDTLPAKAPEASKSKDPSITAEPL